ncbi:MAG: DMT family transporter [Paracoccaceae bacterium]|nr:DMT family transporter [Paracoccaceae bacterium]
MRLFFLTSVTMIAFAANSVLTRMALAEGRIGPADFSAIRLGAAAGALYLLVRLRGGSPRLWRPGRWRAVLALTVYVIGFSFAYVSLPAGVGALILFGAVQVTMFAVAIGGSEAVAPRRLIGAAIAFAGLIWLMWPGGGAAPDPLGAGLMAAAGVGWGIYSVLGRASGDPTMETAANFLLAVPFGLVALLVTAEVPPTADGIALALTSGVVTSGLGYALWYSILPRMQTSVAAIAQLTVPVIATAAGVVLMGEAVTTRFTFATVLVIGGVAVSLRPARRTGRATAQVSPNGEG